MSKDVLLILKVTEGYSFSDERKAEIIKEISEQKKQGVIILPKTVELVDHVEVENADDSGEAEDPRVDDSGEVETPQHTYRACGNCQLFYKNASGCYLCGHTNKYVDIKLRTVESTNIACIHYQPKRRPK